MVVVHVDALSLAGVAIASGHATTDFCQPKTRLFASYTIPPASVLGIGCAVGDVEAATLAAFATSSVLHFRHDVGGIGPSVAMHATWVAALVVLGDRMAFDMFAVFYVFFHAPMHFASSLRSERIAIAASSACIAPFAMAWLASSPQTVAFDLTLFLQLVVVCHVVLCEVCEV